MRAKTAELGDLSRIQVTSGSAAITQWFANGDKAFCVYPAYYLDIKPPHLYSFEEHGETHEYSRRMKDAVEALNLTPWFSHVKGCSFSVNALPAAALPIDLAWVDSHDYKEFFEAVWPYLNDRGGLMMFHNTVSRKYGWNAIQWMKTKRAAANDIEVMTLPEIHKLDQSSCTLVRRVTNYQPPCLTLFPENILSNARKFMASKAS